MASVLPRWTFYPDSPVTLHILHPLEPLSDPSPVFCILALPATPAQDTHLPWGWWEPGQTGELHLSPLLVMLVRPIKGTCATLLSPAFLQPTDENRRSERQGWSPSTSAPPCSSWAAALLFLHRSLPLSFFPFLFLRVSPSSLRPPCNVQIKKENRV